jgi:sugar transferase (PEP-CTERM system associated)
MSSKFTDRTVVLVLADVVSVITGILCSLLIRLGSAGTLDQLNEQAGWLKISLATVVWILSLYLHDLYDYKIVSRRDELTFRMLQAVGTSWITLAVIYYLFPKFQIGPGTALYSIAISLFLLLTIRLLLYFVLGHPLMGEKILIVGDGAEEIDTIRAATMQRTAGYRIVGFLGDGHHACNSEFQTVPRLGPVSELENVVHSENIDRIVVGLRQRREVVPVEALLRLRLDGNVSIDECSSFYERVAKKVNLDMLRPSWLIFSEHSRNTNLKLAFRDFVHRLLALIGLIVSVPIAVLAAILIKIDSPGPIFYTQERVGKNDRTFVVIKFRSMRCDAEAGGTPVWSSVDDERVTFVGKIIRKIRVDEIPQFWNILKGEMKFVGPRPERPHFVKQLGQSIPFYEHRHLVAPGLTGWAQVKYPYGSSLEDARQKLEYDLYYIKNQTLILDMLIVLQTFKIILLGRGGR